MGLLRLLFAISVFLGHVAPQFGLTMVGGAVAVQSFFIFSGFYISLVLNGKYKNSSYKTFIINRVLKIYPIYWIILFLSLPWGIPIFTHYLQSGSINLGSVITLIITNLFIFGQDILMFLGLDNASGSLYFTANFRVSDPEVWRFLLVPQAWALAIIFYFYLIAPLIVKSKKLIISLLLFSLGARLVFYFFGHNTDPWNYRFFVFELALFLFGAISYFVYKYILNKKINNKFLKISFLSLLLFVVFYQFIPIADTIKQWLFYLLLTLLIPLIFKLTGESKFDRLLGDLSFPLYLCHLLIFYILNNFIDTNVSDNIFVLINLVISLLFSWLLLQFIIKPIIKLRQQKLIK